MKNKRKCGIWLLILAGILSLCIGCYKADTAEISSATDQREQIRENDEKIKIGFCCWGYSDQLSMSYKRYFSYIEDAFHMEIIFKGGSDSLGEQKKYVDELIDEGVQGIVGMRVTGEMMEKCEKAGIYLAQFGSAPRDPELLAYLEKSPYWVGYSTMDEEDCGETLVRSLYTSGVRNVILCAQASSGGAPNGRWTGFLNEAEKHTDMRIAERLRISEGSLFGSEVEKVLSIDSSVDGIVSAQASIGTLESIVEMLKTTKTQKKIKVACADIEGDVKRYFNDGILVCVAGGSYPEVIFLTLSMLDKINGVSTVNGPVALQSKMIYLRSSSEYDLYTKYISDEGVYPYTIEELKAVTTSTNPEATFTDMQKLWSEYSLSEVINRHNLQQ